MNRMRRGRCCLTIGVTIVTTLALAGGIAYATIPGPGGVYSACMLKGVGTIRLIDKSLSSTSLLSRCTDKEIEVSWNQAGQPGPAGPQGAKGDPGAPGTDGANGTNGANGTDGQDGVSVTSASEPSGANCADGGSQLAAANGVSYVCNGTDGQDGTDGEDGVSVESAPEPAGTNCSAGGSKFTAANGVTYACNGTSGSGSSGPVLFAASGGADLPDLNSVTVANLPQLNATATCIGSGLLVIGVRTPATDTRTTMALWEGETSGQTSRYQLTPTNNGGFGFLASNSSTPQSFSVILRMPNGISFKLHGKGTAVGDDCSIMYHVVVSQ